MFVYINFLYNFSSSSSDKPDAPGVPECKATTEDTVTLTWEPPLHDGGRPVTGYVVEKKMKGDRRWTK